MTAFEFIGSVASRMRRLTGRPDRPSEPPSAAQTPPAPSAPAEAAGFHKFERRFPSLQNAVDLFRGKWACNLGKVSEVGESGPHDLFTPDFCTHAARILGNGGSFAGMKILELGPLEAAHTYQMERLGAEHILAIEANAEAYLKCLIVKETLGLTRARFLLGDFAEYLARLQDRYDMVLCSGVLYHMVDPISVIRDIARVTDRCFVWTHYYDPAHAARSGPMVHTAVTRHGFAAAYHQLQYPNREDGTFWGGNRPTACWMEREAILDCFKRFGLDQITMVLEQPDHPRGPCFNFAAERRSDARH
jgi:hypothetical protein